MGGTPPRQPERSASPEWQGRRFARTPATAPGPVGPEMLRSFSAIRSNPLAYLDTVWHRHGDVVQFPIPRPPSYLVNDPESVRRVLVGNARAYGKRTIQYRSLSLVTGDGLLVADTEEWRRQRPLVQPAFHHETLERVLDHSARAIDEVAAGWRSLPSGAVVDIDAAMMQAALGVVGSALFGSDLSADAEDLTAATLAALEVVVARARVPITPPSWVPTPANRTLASSVGKLDRAVARMMRDRRRVDRTEPADMLDLLMSARDDAGEALTARGVRDQIVTFIVAGHETVASALTWAWGLLAQHPHWQDRLRDEAREVIGDRRAGWSDYPRLTVARAVLDEAMRLYPPAWLITRQAREADRLAGYDIPAGALVILSPWLLHRHPRVWPDAESFHPERFLDGSADRTCFAPFGAGPRQCIGRDFSYVEGVLMLAVLARDFSVAFPEGGVLPPADPSVTLRPVGGMALRVARR